MRPRREICPKEEPFDPLASVRLASWQGDSLVDGPGLRMTIFTQGCPHRCPGCHNPETHLPIGGQVISEESLFQLYCSLKVQRGVTLSGGEPFMQAAPLSKFAEKVHEAGGDVITYTGYVWEQLRDKAQTDEGIRDLLKQTDLLIDGRFILSQRSLSLPFRGSLNQRMIPLSWTGWRMIREIPGWREEANHQNFLQLWQDLESQQNGEPVAGAVPEALSL